MEKPTYLILSERMGKGETLEELEAKAHAIMEEAIKKVLHEQGEFEEMA